MPLALKGRNTAAIISALQASSSLCWNEPGATRFALAPGYHIPRLRRCDLTVISRVFGPLIVLSYFIFSAVVQSRWRPVLLSPFLLPRPAHIITNADF